MQTYIGVTFTQVSDSVCRYELCVFESNENGEIIRVSKIIKRTGTKAVRYFIEGKHFQSGGVNLGLFEESKANIMCIDDILLIGEAVTDNETIQAAFELAKLRYINRITEKINSLHEQLESVNQI